MKKKLLAGIMLCVMLSGCTNNTNTESTTTESTTATTSENTEGIPSLNIYTINETIEYEKSENIIDESAILDIAKNKLENDQLIKISNGEQIRIDFLDSVVSNNEINVATWYIKNSTEGYEAIVEESTVSLNENGYADITHSYDTTDNSLKAIMYEISTNIDDKEYFYTFGVKVENVSQTAKEQTVVTGYLTEDEQAIYDNYKKDKNTTYLANLEPITIAKFYAQALIAQEYSVAYSLYIDDESLVITEDEFLDIINGIDENTKEQYISNIKGIQNGEFIAEDTNKGYIQYELIPDHPMALDMIKDSNNIWKIKYMPII